MTEPRPGIAPSDDRDDWPSTTLDVDGERFLVRTSPDGRSTDYDWLTGPNPRYGFGSSGPGGLTADDHQDAIRTFLAGIDPETGYLAD